MINREKFEEDYFVNSDVSNYNDYRKKRYDELASTIINHFKLQKDSKVLDFGCALGELIYQLKIKGMRVCGMDVSNWAVNYGRKELGLHDKEIKNLDWDFLAEECDLLLFLDVLEHLSENWDLPAVMNLLKEHPKKKILVRIPVSKKDNERYVLDVSENDRTHIIRWTKDSWIKIFKEHGYELTETLNYEEVIWDTEGVFCGVFEWKNKKRN